MEDRLNRLFGTDKDREDPRRKAEMKIVWKFLDTVLSHGQQMLTAKRHERLTNEGSARGGHVYGVRVHQRQRHVDPIFMVRTYLM
jgi:hypothetical protein